MFYLDFDYRLYPYRNYVFKEKDQLLVTCGNRKKRFLHEKHSANIKYRHAAVKIVPRKYFVLFYVSHFCLLCAYNVRPFSKRGQNSFNKECLLKLKKKKKQP